MIGRNVTKFDNKTPFVCGCCNESLLGYPAVDLDKGKGVVIKIEPCRFCNTPNSPQITTNDNPWIDFSTEQYPAIGQKVIIQKLANLEFNTTWAINSMASIFKEWHAIPKTFTLSAAAFSNWRDLLPKVGYICEYDLPPEETEVFVRDIAGTISIRKLCAADVKLKWKAR